MQIPQEVLKAIFVAIDQLPYLRKVEKQMGKYKITANIYKHWSNHTVLRIELRIYDDRIYGDKDE